MNTDKARKPGKALTGQPRQANLFQRGRVALDRWGLPCLSANPVRPQRHYGDGISRTPSPNSLLASSKHTAGLPPLIVLHHILVRSPLPLPHTLHGWAEAEYVRWVKEHSEQEAYTLVEGDLSHWEKVAEAEGTDTSPSSEYVQLARNVLANATAKDSGQ